MKEYHEQAGRRAALHAKFLGEIPDSLLEEIAQYYTLPQLLRQDLQSFDYHADNLFVRDVFSRYLIQLAGGLEAMDVNTGSYEDEEYAIKE